jgi:hypothetical protein
MHDGLWFLIVILASTTAFAAVSCASRLIWGDRIGGALPFAVFGLGIIVPVAFIGQYSPGTLPDVTQGSPGTVTVAAIALAVAAAGLEWGVRWFKRQDTQGLSR